jgi:hypothetical protein
MRIAEHNIQLEDRATWHREEPKEAKVDHDGRKSTPQNKHGQIALRM